MSSSSGQHVAIDMSSLNGSRATATELVVEPPLIVAPSSRRRSRSRSRSPSSTSSSARMRSTRDLRTATTDAEPLLHSEGDAEMIPRPQRPPIVHIIPSTPLGPEGMDDDDDDEQAHPRPPNTPQAHPGVDEGFFPADSDFGEKPSNGGFDINSGEGGDESDGPRISPRMGGSDEGIRPRRPSFPIAPGLDGTAIIVPDLNVYQQKKTLAQGMMDLALLSANANQMRYVIESWPNHPYYYVSLTFIAISIALQIAVGVGLIWNSRYNVKNQDDICKADRINNFTVMGIFLITAVNVFVSSFGVAQMPDTRNSTG